jgi:hypothetical protein
MSCIRIGSRTNERNTKKKDCGRKKKNAKENGGWAKFWRRYILPLKLILVVTMMWHMRGRLRIWQQWEKRKVPRGGAGTMLVSYAEHIQQQKHLN